jgi:hypothetical protein
MEENKINRLKSNLQIFRNWSIVITILAMISLIYILNERYEDLKMSFDSKVRTELYDEWQKTRDDDFYYIDSEEEELFYSLARQEYKEKHLNDNLEDSVDFYYNSDHREEIEWYISAKKEENTYDKKKIDSLIKSIRLEIRNKLIWKRINSIAKEAISKEQYRIDSLSDIELNSIEFITQYRVKNENILTHFPISYLFGAFFGASIIPLFFWLIWALLKTNLKNTIESEKNRKIQQIKGHKIFSSEYIRKYESLLDLKESNIINQNQFTTKHDDLIQYYSIKIIEEIRYEEKNELKIKLRTALEIGNITQDEFDLKFKTIDLNLTESQLLEACNFVMVSYDTDKGKVEIQQINTISLPQTGNKAFINGQPAPSDEYKFGFMWYVHIKNGIVSKTTFFLKKNW